MWPVISRRDRGFTLVEVLVALAVFAVVGAVAYRGLDTMAADKARLDSEIRFWRQLGQTMDRIETDVTQITPQTQFDASGLQHAPVFYGLRQGAFVLELIRFDGMRPPLQVAYRVLDQHLELLIQRENEQKVYRLLDDVERMTITFLDEQQTWRSSWPISANRSRPQGVRIRLTIRGRGDFDRVFSLP